ncbi:hypothetical protein [uncultured Treponema sp.]|uniref:hypothetical protein n=1 Tax=uncultured Treponema sp. TaxID=162155 RepID=UPI002597D56E|nr:hypothetical protein [uncultured Treponema sp.]
MRLQSYLQTEFAPNGITDRSTNLQNVKMNGIVFDFRFTPSEEYIQGTTSGKSAYRVLKNIVVNVNYRDGVGAGKNALLIDRVNLFLLMEHSDFIAGLDITQTPMEAGKEWRACGHLGLGYLSVSENASLDIQCYVTQNPEITSKLYVSTELRERSDVQIVQYRQTKPTGASQTFENVLSAFISTEKELNDTVSTSDYMSNEVLNIETCIALSNAVGRFEKFKRYGQFYEDEFGVGQTLTFNCPNINDDEQILMCCRVFNLSAQMSGNSEFVNDARALMSKIASVDPDKFKSLQLEGVNTYGVTLSA